MRFLYILSAIFVAIPLAPLQVKAEVACSLPKTIGRRVTTGSKPLYSLKLGSDIYTFWRTSFEEGRQTFAFDSVVKKDKQNHCYLSFTDVSGEPTTLTHGVPKIVAQTFAIKQLKDRIKKVGKPSLQNELNAMSSKDVLAQEDVDALRSLGLTLPSTVRVIPYNTGPLYQHKYR
jgi:hypothetical protein